MNNSPVKILGAFVDTLVLNAYPTNGQFQIERTDLPMSLKAELDYLKELAQDQEEDIPSRFIFGGTNLLMRTKGAEGFNWILRNDHLTVAVNRSSKMRLWAQVRCSSQYLWSVRDIGKVVSDVHLFLTMIFGQLITVQPSALDLAVDVAFLDLGSIQDVKQHFVTRAQLTELIPADIAETMIDGPNSIKQRWGRITGLPFGARTGAVSALLYDKTHEIKYHSPQKGWFFDFWEHEAEKQGFCILKDRIQVWRDEIRFKRPALNEMQQGETFHGIDDAYDLESRLPGLWSYAVGHIGGGLDGLPDGWLRYITPVEDTNRSRWPVHPDWEVIQAAFTPQVIEESSYDLEQQEREEILRDLDAYLTAHPRPPVAAAASAPPRPFIPFGPLPPAPLGEPEVIPSSSPLPPVPKPSPAFDLVPYVRRRKCEVNMRRMVAQIAGCLITAEAWRLSPEDGTEPDISDTIHFIYSSVEAYLQEQQRDFTDSVHKKRVLYSLEQTLARLDQQVTA